MTVELLYIAATLGGILAGYGLSRYIYRPKKPVQPLPAPKSDLEALEKRIFELEKHRDIVELSQVEMKELITRSMNRMSARSAKLDKNTETWEQMKELLEQSAQVDAGEMNGNVNQGNQTTMFPGRGRRLVRIHKGDQ